MPRGLRRSERLRPRAGRACRTLASVVGLYRLDSLGDRLREVSRPAQAECRAPSDASVFAGCAGICPGASCVLCRAGAGPSWSPCCGTTVRPSAPDQRTTVREPHRSVRPTAAANRSARSAVRYEWSNIACVVRCGQSVGFPDARAASSSAATASRSRDIVSGLPDSSSSCRRPRAARTASRRARVRVRAASSGAEASKAVSRSSTAVTRPAATFQPPAACASEPIWRSSGTSTRANHATSSSADARSARDARRRRALTTSGTATATATATAPSSHHNHEGAPDDSADDG
jgi:hypothetical protein